MQTFLPLNEYTDSAKVLDPKRLGKQRVEAYQILKALLNETNAWANHPATRMWAGNEYELALYGLTVSVEFYERGYDGYRMIEVFNKYMVQLKDRNEEHNPWFVNDADFMLSHQSNLLRKMPEYYERYFSGVPNNLPYLWPLQDEEAFRLGTIKKGDDVAVIKNSAVYLTSKQIAELLGVSPKTISAYKARGQMPKPDREYGRTPLWRLSTIQQWREDLRTPIRVQE